jgi:hypothetical protein
MIFFLENLRNPARALRVGFMRQFSTIQLDSSRFHVSAFDHSSHPMSCEIQLSNSETHVYRFLRAWRPDESTNPRIRRLCVPLTDRYLITTAVLLTTTAVVGTAL